MPYRSSPEETKARLPFATLMGRILFASVVVLAVVVAVCVCATIIKRTSLYVLHGD